MSSHRATIVFGVLIYLMTVLGSTATYAECTSYYIDAQNGNDDADGRSEKSAWKTVSRNDLWPKDGQRLEPLVP